MLAIIDQQEVYGYELSIKLKEKGLNFVSEGSIYPLLQRMQRDKLIVGTLRDSPAGPQRKYYRLTSEGQNALCDFLENWQLIKSAVDNLIVSEGAECL